MVPEGVIFVADTGNRRIVYKALRPSVFLEPKKTESRRAQGGTSGETGYCRPKSKKTRSDQGFGQERKEYVLIPLSLSSLSTKG